MIKSNENKVRLNKFMEQNKNLKLDSIFHKSFEISILLKAINGILVIIGGSLLIFFNPTRLNKIIIILTQS